MSKQGVQINDLLNLIVSGGIAIFSTLLGSSLLVSLALEKEKVDGYLVLLGSALLFGGLGCGVYFYYVLKKRVNKPLYRVSLILTTAGFIFALIAMWFYQKNI